MSANQNPKILRIVKVILDILFGLLVIVSVFLFLWIALSPFILSMSSITIMSSVPVAIGTGNDPRMDVEIAGADAEGIQIAYIDEAQGTLRLETTDWYLIFISNLAKLLTAVGLAYLIFLLRSVIIAIQNGEIFTQQNVLRIRRLGYLVLIVAFVKAALEYFAAFELLNQLTIVEPLLSLPSPFEAEVILASLLILVLAQVWSYGLELERERALTV
ncbi:MAG TPA: DUF2975 domain-containing protein [Anaerolineales bacterium]|nr:DUF2975 domain-containing protein [Anaerolineales bacterium]